MRHDINVQQPAALYHAESAAHRQKEPVSAWLHPSRPPREVSGAILRRVSEDGEGREDQVYRGC